MNQHLHLLHHHRVVQELLNLVDHDYHHSHQILVIYMVSTKEILVVVYHQRGFPEFH
jgi:hypothetical protein